MKLLRSSFLYLAFVPLSISCTKEQSYISVSSPANGAVFNAGDRVGIEADMWNTDALLGESLLVTSGANYTDTVLFFIDDKDLYSSKYHLSKAFVCQGGAQYKITIHATGSGSGAVERVYVSGR